MIFLKFLTNFDRSSRDILKMVQRLESLHQLHDRER
jgi:hypothetical protein